MEQEGVTEKIIGAAYKIHNTMGFGFLESVYEKCLCIELEKAGLVFEEQKSMAVSYDGQIVGDFVAEKIRAIL